jgi:hypothetical protein
MDHAWQLAANKWNTVTVPLSAHCTICNNNNNNNSNTIQHAACFNLIILM